MAAYEAMSGYAAPPLKTSGTVVLVAAIAFIGEVAAVVVHHVAIQHVACHHVAIHHVVGHHVPVPHVVGHHVVLLALVVTVTG